jgi:hypothetical protein
MVTCAQRCTKPLLEALLRAGIGARALRFLLNEPFALNWQN